MLIYDKPLKTEETALVRALLDKQPLASFDSYKAGEIKNQDVLFLFDVSEGLKEHLVIKDQFGNRCMKTKAPRDVIRHPPYSLDFIHSATKFCKLDEHANYWKKVEKANNKQLTYKVVEHFKDVYAEMSAQKEWSTDIESRGFNFKRDKVLISGFYNGFLDMSYIIILRTQDKEDIKLLRLFMENPEISFIWQNGKFDCKFFRSQYNIKAKVDEDTLIQSYVLDERGGDDDSKISSTNKSIHGLEYLAGDILNAPGYKGAVDFETVSDMDPKLHYYNAQDIVYTYWVYKFQKALIDVDSNLSRLYYNLLIPASEFLMRIELNGIKVNANYLKELDIKYSTALEDMWKELAKIAIQVGFSGAEYVLDGFAKKAPTEFNPGSPKQLGYLIFNKLGMPRHKGRDSTDEDALNYWLFERLKFPKADLNDVTEEELFSWMGEDICKRFLYKLVYYRKFKKLHSTYIIGIDEKKDIETNRIHATYKIHGTVTGRLASSGPNMQNIPRKAEIKNIFTADEGKVLVTVDYSQAELRVLACLSGDKAMISAYKNGMDLHDENSKKIFGPNFTKEQRVQVKAFVFGSAYGRGAESVAADFKMPIAQAKQIHSQLFMNLPEAAKFIANARASCLSAEPVATIFGRYRRFGLITQKNKNSCENESVNFPIQSTASDFTLTSGIEFQKWLDENKHNDVKIVNIVHDDILFETPPEKAEMLAKKLIEIMDTVPRKYFGDMIPWEADPEICGIGWGDKKKLKI